MASHVEKHTHRHQHPHHETTTETVAAAAATSSVDTSAVNITGDVDDNTFATVQALAAAGNPEATRILLDIQRLAETNRQLKAAPPVETPASNPDILATLPAAKPETAAAAAAFATTVETTAIPQEQAVAAATATATTHTEEGHHVRAVKATPPATRGHAA